MKRLFGLLIILSVFLVGCSNDSSVFEPLVGTWKADNAIGTTTLVLNKDDTAVQTYAVGSAVTTKNGTWSSNDNTVTRTWSSSDIDTDYYSLSSNNSVLTLSKTPNGTATVYERQ